MDPLDGLFRVDEPHPRIHHVQIFENRGEMMGASSPRLRGQIWATEHLPMHVDRERTIGYELLAEPHRDVTAEEAADLLRRA